MTTEAGGRRSLSEAAPPWISVRLEAGGWWLVAGHHVTLYFYIRKLWRSDWQFAESHGLQNKKERPSVNYLSITCQYTCTPWQLRVSDEEIR